MRTRLAGALSWGLLVTAMAGVLTLTAACGSARAGPGSQPATSVGSAATSAAGAATSAAGAATSAAVPLCADVAHLDRMVLSLGSGFTSSHVREALPAGVTIVDPARVRAMAAALCGLPVMATTHMLCPDHSGFYRLTFSAAGRMFPPVMIGPAGCRWSVSGLGPVRLATGSVMSLLRADLEHIHPIVTPVPLAA